MQDKGVTPKLVILCIQPDSRSLAYMRAKTKRAEQIGITTEIIELDSSSPQEVAVAIEKLNIDPLVHGIILQLPIPPQFDKQQTIDLIDPIKDVDGLTTTNQHGLEDSSNIFTPATPLGVIELLRAYQVDIADKTACVIGRSNLVGKPTAILLERAGAKVLVAHKQTEDIKALTLQADIIVSAAGHPRLVTADMVKTGAVVIDVGITEENQHLHGDVDFEAVAAKASKITPVPGGVGPMTVVMLLSNVVKAAKLS